MKRQMSPGVEGGFGIFASGHSDRAVGWGEALEGVRRNGLDVVCCLKLCHDVFTYWTDSILVYSYTCYSFAPGSQAFEPENARWRDSEANSHVEVEAVCGWPQHVAEACTNDNAPKRRAPCLHCCQYLFVAALLVVTEIPQVQCSLMLTRSKRRFVHPCLKRNWTLRTGSKGSMNGFVDMKHGHVKVLFQIGGKGSWESTHFPVFKVVASLSQSSTRWHTSPLWGSALVWFCDILCKSHEMCHVLSCCFFALRFGSLHSTCISHSNKVKWFAAWFCSRTCSKPLDGAALRNRQGTSSSPGWL